MSSLRWTGTKRPNVKVERSSFPFPFHPFERSLYSGNRGSSAGSGSSSAGSVSGKVRARLAGL
jgi:hypothetical protein